MHGTTENVVRKAYRILEKDGLIVREAGRGTFVRRASSVAPVHKPVLLFCQYGLLQGYFESLSLAASKRGTFFNPLTLMSENAYTWKQELALLAERGISGVLVDVSARSIALDDVLDAVAGRPVCFVNRWEWPVPVSLPAVLVEYVSAYTRALQYFVTKQYERVLFIGHHPEPAWHVRASLEAAADAAGLGFPSARLQYVWVGEPEEREERIRDLFDGARPRPALLGASDRVLFDFVNRLKEIVPDVDGRGCCGFWDTLWSRQWFLPFHSFRVDFGEMWNAALAKVLEPERKPRVTWIEPVFVARDRPDANRAAKEARA